nr:pantoate--beta-alanine ligase [Phycisphaerae bacterium]
MDIVTDSLDARTACRNARANNASVGLVPTMGALHKGHLALIDCAKRECDFVVVSIFVNPDQFGRGEDFDAYPRSSEQDFELCRRHGVDIIFYPETDTFAGGGRTVSVHESVLSQALCGRFRPGHFDGVLTVVTKLFNVIEPDRAYFGQKDIQQCILIQRMVRDLQYNIQIVVLPTIREEDGLALSSRNAYLSADERVRALVLYRGLKAVEESLRGGVRSGTTLR